MLCESAVNALVPVLAWELSCVGPIQQHLKRGGPCRGVQHALCGRNATAGPSRNPRSNSHAHAHPRSAGPERPGVPEQ